MLSGETPLSFFIAEPILNHSKEDEVHYNPLININADERAVFDILETVYSKPKDSFSIFPRGFYSTMRDVGNGYRLTPFLHGRFAPNYWQIVSSAGLEYHYSNKKGGFVPGGSGKIFNHPSNFAMVQTGNAVFLNSIAFYWELKEHNFFNNHAQWDSFSVEFNRVYAKIKLLKLSAMFGKDTLHLGPGEHGLILSSNAAPYWMVKVQNEETLKLWGDWNFVVMKGWLSEEREDASNPEIFAVRLTYRPPGKFNFFELGLTRTMMYSGKGLHRHTLVEYPVLISGAKDNVPRNKYDADSFGGIDFTFNIPVYKINPAVKVFKLYIEEAGTDIKAIWQVEDMGEFTLPYILFKFYERAYLLGMFIGLKRDTFRLEYTKTAFSFYRHHLYPVEGYSYKGLSLGHPLGRNHQALKFNHTRWFHNNFSFKWEIGYYQLNCEKKMDKNKFYTALFPMFSLDKGLVRRGYVSLWADWVVKGHILRGYFSLDAGPKSDADPSPIHVKPVDKATVDIVFGLSTIIKF
ncbi:MAG: capsule assembly Wzi family protein [bacterium]